MLRGWNDTKMKQPEQSEYKQRLLDAARELIFANGLEGLTAGKLASHVGLKRTVVHYHFRTMDHLLAILITQSMQSISSSIRKQFNPATFGDDIWALYRNAMHATETVRAR